MPFPKRIEDALTKYDERPIMKRLKVHPAIKALRKCKEDDLLGMFNCFRENYEDIRWKMEDTSSYSFQVYLDVLREIHPDNTLDACALSINVALPLFSLDDAGLLSQNNFIKIKPLLNLYPVVLILETLQKNNLLSQDNFDAIVGLLNDPVKQKFNDAITKKTIFSTLRWTPSTARDLFDGLAQLDIKGDLSQEALDALIARLSLNELPKDYKKYAEIDINVYAQEEAMRYLSSLSNPDTSHGFNAFMDIMKRMDQNGIEAIWDKIKDRISDRMISIYRDFYDNDKNHPDFIRLIDQGRSVKIENDLRCFQERLVDSQGYRKFCSETIRMPGRFFPSEAEQLSNQRHNSPENQKKYDERFGVIIKKK